MDSVWIISAISIVTVGAIAWRAWQPRRLGDDDGAVGGHLAGAGAGGGTRR